MSNINKAMVMAAGLGKRMRPLTDEMPKPLVSVDGVSLIDRTLDWLAASNIDEVVVNTHYKAEMLEEHLARRQNLHLHISREEMLLETGGGVKKAMPFLGDGPFFVINSDVICIDGQVSAPYRMQEYWDESNMDILLLLHPVAKAVGYGGAGDFFVEEDNTLRRKKPDEEQAPYVFTGVQIFHPHLMQHAPKQDVFSLNALYDYVISNYPSRLKGLIHDGQWLHIGDPEGVLLAEQFLSK